ncbi:MAG: PSD1 and planctomycete cytochrome C domain-containing protein [Fimbriimonadales bacterium]
MQFQRLILAGSAAFTALTIAATPDTRPQDSPGFEQRIWPNLKARCGTCHAGSNPAGGLNLTTRDGINKGGVSGPLVNTSNPDDSVLLHRLLGKDGKQRMPLGFAPLLSEEISAIRAWIAAGAKISSESALPWSFVPPVRPEVPVVRNKTWIRNPIDAFVAATLERAGLNPSAEASKQSLIRRVSLDLIGLPPTPEEVDAFVNDKSQTAYEKVVDRLLASPRYGERQARIWLDLARYADSNGYEKDGGRSIWPYRDWVIRAFNANMPYDKFTVEQIAGDLLPNPTIAQLVATGFNRNTMKNEEGGVDQEEALFEVEIDRVTTTSTVWLGLTVGCARCHDHKYDPITMRDFYGMMAFFANPDVAKLGDASISEQKYTEPSMEVPSEQQIAERATLQAKLVAAEAKYKTAASGTTNDRTEQEAAATHGVAWTTLRTTTLTSVGGAKFSQRPDGVIDATGENPAKDTYKLSFDLGPSPVSALLIEPVPDKAYANGGPGRSDSGNFVLSRVVVQSAGKSIPFSPTVDFAQGGYSARGVLDNDVETGWAIYGEAAVPHKLVLSLLQPTKGRIELVLEFQSQWKQHVFGKFKVSSSADPYAWTAATPSAIRSLLPSQVRTDAQNKQISEYFTSADPRLEDVRNDLESAKAALTKLNDSIPRTLVMRDKPGIRELTANIHNRGEFLNKGELVKASSISSLHQMPSNEAANRLDLANWLVSKQNPLTARVQVNRMWEQLFGRGIVETTENFGTQSAPASHPELLDWLATEFMHRNWNVKAMMKLMVMSAAYRQSSNGTQAAVAKDPENRLISRGPRFRLEAETVRDSALHIAGLLSKKMFGPPVYPYQPEGVWNSPFNGERWMISDGEDKYRRGIYTYVKRTAPFPMFTTFDSGSRESCLVRRIRTNTPLQSLALLNDQNFVDAAKALGKRMSAYKSANVKEKVAFGFKLCTSREPTPAELTRMSEFYTKMKRQYAGTPEDATRFAGSVDAASWAMLGNLLLNLDETITKG